MAFPIAAAAAIAVPLIQSLFQKGEAKGKQRQADLANAQIPYEDAGVRSLLDQYRQRQQYAEAGQTRMLGVKRRMAEDAQVQTQANLGRAAGGSTGTYIDSLLRSQNLTQRQLMQAGAETEQLGVQYLDRQVPLVADQSDRRLSLQTGRADTYSGQAAQAQQNSSSNLNAALAMLGGMDWSAGAAKGGPTDMQIQGSQPATMMQTNPINVSSYGTGATPLSYQPNSY